MIPIIIEKPTVVIAGPGAGKTYDMVDKIINAIPQLKTNRILAAITYTNAATNSIREKLLRAMIYIPPNIFVGTTYSFFNNFILLPFATLYGLVGLDKMFLEIADKKKGNNQGHAQFAAIRKRHIKSLLMQGKVPFEQIATVSAELMEFPQVQKIVSNRIQFLFKDEFQDTDTTQLKVFNIIKKSKKTVIYSVGDPEQYILGFTYNGKPGSKPSFKNIPINKFITGCNKLERKVNKRSCDQIVEFTNNFHTSIQQISEVGQINDGGVFFIMDTDLDIIIPKFNKLTQSIIDSHEKCKRLFLGKRRKTFDGFVEKYGLTRLSNKHGCTKSLLAESLELISFASQLNTKQIKEQFGWDIIEHRKLGIKLLRAILLGHVQSGESLDLFLNKHLKTKGSHITSDINNKLQNIKNVLNNEEFAGKKNYYSTIHKAKGLEGDCVLVISQDQKELNQWLETDHEQRHNDKEDTCRIGYVGFTRAKKLLCIACMKPIDNTVREKLLSLKANIIN